MSLFRKELHLKT